MQLQRSLARGSHAISHGATSISALSCARRLSVSTSSSAQKSVMPLNALPTATACNERAHTHTQAKAMPERDLPSRGGGRPRLQAEKQCATSVRQLLGYGQAGTEDVSGSAKEQHLPESTSLPSLLRTSIGPPSPEAVPREGRGQHCRRPVLSVQSGIDGDYCSPAY